MSQVSFPPTVRVRFAPSPSGYLHIGGARTALFNYLYARQHDGVLVLRVEDTHRERSTPESIRAILDGMRYLGLDWDEGPEVGGPCGPYFQSQRVESYRPQVDRLLASGQAYRCFCTKERLAALREQQRGTTGRVLYDRACLHLCAEEVERRVGSGEPSAVRFRVPEGETRINDLIRGDVTFRNDAIEDFIIQRSDASVVYNFAVVGDDSGMKITHVIRGEDHLSNTPKQILLFEALGLEPPQYAHIPLILAPGGGKLSKRHGAVSVAEYEAQGYLPEAMLNFLARMGWSYDDKQEVFSREELIGKFSFAGVSKGGAMYDLKKLQNLGGHYMRRRSAEEVLDLAIPYLVSAGLTTESRIAESRPRLRFMMELEKERMHCVSEVVERVRYYFEDPSELDKGARKALRKKKDFAAAVLSYAESLAESIADGAWTIDNVAQLEEHARAFVRANNMGLGDLAQPLRAILTGRSATPGLFEVMAILGRDICLRRLAKAPERFAEAAE